jgi:integrase
VAHAMIPAAVYHGLSALENLRRGKTDARESTPVPTVPQGTVDTILPYLSRQLAAMVQLQCLTGARPGEICRMRAVDIDMSGKTWVYKPDRHKTAHLGYERIIHLGEKCQRLIEPFLKPDVQAHLFSPADAVAEMLERRRAARKTPASCGNVPGSNRVKNLKRAPGKSYNVNVYRKAIISACERAGVEPFHPHQLRHNAATTFAREYGVDAARALLGHRMASPNRRNDCRRQRRVCFRR